MSAGASEPAERSVLGSRAGLWLGLGAVCAAVSPAESRALVLLAYNALLAALFVWDRARLSDVELQIERVLPRQLPVRTYTPYALEVALRRGPPLRLILEEAVTDRAELIPGRYRLELAPGRRAELRGEITMPQHGVLALSSIAGKRETRLGLCAVVTQHALPAVLRAYPEREQKRRALLGQARRTPGQVAAPARVAEQGGEIECLREYVATDPMRSIDWKASAKRRRPITRAYQPERNQTLWIVLDASRAMTLPAERREPTSPVRTRFDASLSAALDLAENALFQGDRVGFLAYGSSALLCLPPRTGRAHLLDLLEHSLRLHARPEALDTTGLLTTLSKYAPKRSLVVLFTDLDNEGDLRELSRKAHVVSSRHVSLCVSLRSPELDALVRGSVEHEHEVYQKLAAISLHEQRRQLARALSLAGLPVVESGPLELSQTIIARYRRAKISGRI